MKKYLWCLTELMLVYQRLQNLVQMRRRLLKPNVNMVYKGFVIHFSSSFFNRCLKNDDGNTKRNEIKRLTICYRHTTTKSQTKRHNSFLHSWSRQKSGSFYDYGT